MKCNNALGEGMTSNEMLFLVGKRKALWDQFQILIFEPIVFDKEEEIKKYLKIWVIL